VAKDLSQDHKPDLPEERVRLEKAGAIVTPPGKAGKPPARVWSRGPTPSGLAMSRSIGDLGMRRWGVIPDPEVREYELDVGGDGERDLFLIVASDGIWEFIESQEACEIAHRFADASEASEALVREAQQRWKAEEKTYQDDITVIVARLPFLESDALDA
jgi:protein phosphatase 2C family protein 2/3